MGNSHTQPLSTQHHLHIQQLQQHNIYHQNPQSADQWTRSLPYHPLSRLPSSHKLVIPDRNAHQRLRHTDNGEILHSGGTISGRQRANHFVGAIPSSSSSSARSQPPARIYQQQNQHPHHQYRKTRIPVYKREMRELPRVQPHRTDHQQMKKYGSEPDLRAGPSSGASNGESPSYADRYVDRYKTRKKYKAPQPPLMTPLSSIDTNNDISPIRRARLFKTRAETTKKKSSPPDAPDESIVKDNLPLKRPPYQMLRTRSSPEFQAELKQVTKRLVTLKSQVAEKNKLQTLDPPRRTQPAPPPAPVEERSPASGKESTPDLDTDHRPNNNKLAKNVKTFYFGMDRHSLDGKPKIPNSIGSSDNDEHEDDFASESDCEDPALSPLQNDISLQLRPILPKKQLEVPRFSPSAAWKLLSAVDPLNNTDEDAPAGEDPAVGVFLEDKIENCSRVPPPWMPNGHQRSNNDKSGDSGISGDETPDNLAQLLPPNAPKIVSWTPQQDLDDSSLDEADPQLEGNEPLGNPPGRPHVFSLSLPRDNQLGAYISTSYLQPYSSLQKLKRSMSGPNLEEENWFLSRSAPNSLNNGFNSLEHTRSKKSDEPNKQTRPRIMYLPQGDGTNKSNLLQSKPKSKSHENISVLSKPAKISAPTSKTERSKPQNLQDPPPVQGTHNKWTKKKAKKFTFQSTMRQIERKRLADKLSREAERKELQRRQELEAMQRVEEEFQKKRAREKATIRQQLRLYNSNTNTGNCTNKEKDQAQSVWSSLPPTLNLESIRPEPDGAVSSSTSSSSPTFTKTKAERTHVLSEFRQLDKREYKEFQIGAPAIITGTTHHPRITCNVMPKAKKSYKKY